MRDLSLQVDSAFEEFVVRFGDSLEEAFLPLLDFLVATEHLLLWLPWYATVGFFVVLGALASRGIKVPVLVFLFLGAIVALDLWEPAMETMALMLVATLLSVLLGFPIGVFAARSDRFQALTLPCLDVMQTLPIFVYLIPFVMLFGPGKIPALLSTIVFAMPPSIRLTNVGIRQVDPNVLEAAESFGAGSWQKLFGVQIPLSMPAILAGINQTTMMALSMVVIASMIGAGGLGYQVLQGIQRLEVSRGLFAGLGIVFLAMTFDRIAQSYGKHYHGGRVENEK